MNKKQPPLSITNLTKMYGSDLGVKDINLELKSGEVFGFLGPNGAGKSTTIRTIMNFISPTKGNVKVYGLDSVSDSVAIKSSVGYLAGDIALYEWMNARQLLEYVDSLNKGVDWKYVEELVERLEASLDRPIRDLSKGNKQKIGLIQAFMHRPDLLILDEPTSGLDPLMKQVFYDLIDDMKADGKTVFVSSHDLTEVQKICDRAAFISKGKLVGVEEIQAAQQLTLRRYQVIFESSPQAEDYKRLKNVSEIEIDGNQLTAVVNGSVSKFLQTVAKHQPVDLHEQETSLEEMFMHYYESGDKDV